MGAGLDGAGTKADPGAFRGRLRRATASDRRRVVPDNEDHSFVCYKMVRYACLASSQWFLLMNMICGHL